MAINTECGSKRFMLLKATATKVPIAATKPGCSTSEVVCSKVFVARAFFKAERHGALVEANDTLTAFFLQAGRHRAAAGHLERGVERARAEHLDVSFQVADVKALPFAGHSFDVVLLTFGVMFAPDQARSAAEMLRVCRRGGFIGMANCTPEGCIGQLFKTLGRQIPPPAGVQVTPTLTLTTERLMAQLRPLAKQRP